MIEAHVARSLNVSEDLVRKTVPCPCCGMCMVYATGNGKVSFHPWGGEADELSECVVISNLRESKALVDHLDSGPEHPLNDDVKRILREAFAS